MRGPLSAGRIARSLLRASGTIAMLAALVGPSTLLAGVPTGSAQHARGHLAAPSFLTPTVSVDALNSPYYYPPSIDVSGQNFTPGDSVHVQLIASDGSIVGSVLAEGDITTTLDAYLPRGDGQDILVPGGEFGITLTPSVASELLCQAMTHAVVTAVDTATGESATSYSVDIARWGCVASTLTPTPTATPTGGSQ